MKMYLILRKLNIEGAFNVFPARLNFIQLSINMLVLQFKFHQFFFFKIFFKYLNLL